MAAFMEHFVFSQSSFPSESNQPCHLLFHTNTFVLTQLKGYETLPIILAGDQISTIIVKNMIKWETKIISKEML